MERRRRPLTRCAREDRPAGHRAHTHRTIRSGVRQTRYSGILAVLTLVALGVVTSMTFAEDELPVMIGSQLSPAIQVEVEPRCSEVRFRHPEVKVWWSIDAGAVEGLAGSTELVSATDYRLDTTKFHSGFDTGRFESVAVHSAIAKSGAGRGDSFAPHSTVIGVLEPGVYYHARVLVQTSEGWVPSSTVGFLSSVCPVDGLDEE